MKTFNLHLFGIVRIKCGSNMRRVLWLINTSRISSGKVKIQFINLTAVLVLIEPSMGKNNE